MQAPARRPAQHGAAVGDSERCEPEPDARVVRESREEDQHRPEQRPRRKSEHRAEEVASPPAGKGVERQVHRTDDEEGGAEEDAVVVEHTGHRQCRDEHRDQRHEQRGADEGLLGVDGVRQPGVGGPGPPERREHEHAATDSGERRVSSEQRRDLREREHEDEVEEELSRGDAVLVVDCRSGHPVRP